MSLTVFTIGLAAAVASGISTYRTVGLYGGPVASGFHREWNPVTRRYQLVHETTNKAGARIRTEYTDDLRPRTFQISSKVSPEDAEAVAAVTGRYGFSTHSDTVIDAWVIRDPKTQSAVIEVSTKRDGVVDRWEHYLKGQLVRVDLDTNRNGKRDRWMTYQQGIIEETVIDVNEDGLPDPSR